MPLKAGWNLSASVRFCYSQKIMSLYSDKELLVQMTTFYVKMLTGEIFSVAVKGSAPIGNVIKMFRKQEQQLVCRACNNYFK